MAANAFTTANFKNGIPSQVILDAGINVFALKLLMESFTEANGNRTGPLEFTYLGVEIRLQIETNSLDTQPGQE